MIDRNLSYCPSCKGEYLPEIIQCGICQIELISGEKLMENQDQKQSILNARKGELTPEDEIVAIFTGSLTDVKRFESKFKEENIGYLTIGEDPSCNKGCCGGGQVELQVRKEDASVAMEIINLEYTMSTASNDQENYFDKGFDPESESNSCPACGTIFTTTSTTCPDCGLCFG